MKKSTVLLFILIIVIMAVAPLIALKDAEFGGSDGAGSDMISEITETEYEPWFIPVAEMVIPNGIPGEVESLLFCVQTGIGVGILAYFFGYFSARKKFSKEA